MLNERDLQHMKKKTINVIYCGINSHMSEHGRAMQIYTRLAKKSNIKITWVNPPFFSKNLKANLNAIINFANKNEIKIYENINGYQPVGVPFSQQSKLLWKLSEKIVAWFLDNLKIKCDLLIISSPIFVGYAKLLRKRGTPLIYDCRDLYSGWAHVGKYAIEKEKELINLSNTVITSSESIKNEILNINQNANVVSIPNGVPRNMIKKCSDKPNSSRPRIGFVGHMGYYVDIDLVIEIAKERPNIDFVLVGDCTHIGNNVKNAPHNCNFMGEVPFETLDKLYCSFDVGLIPFKVNDLTNPIIPIKLIEYFAKGLPVVCSPLNEVRRLDEKNLIHYATRKDEWLNKIDIALIDDRNEKFIKFAKKFTWEDATEKYVLVIESLFHHS